MTTRNRTKAPALERFKLNLIIFVTTAILFVLAGLGVGKSVTESVGVSSANAGVAPSTGNPALVVPQNPTQLQPTNPPTNTTAATTAATTTAAPTTAPSTTSATTTAATTTAAPVAAKTAAPVTTAAAAAKTAAPAPAKTVAPVRNTPKPRTGSS